MTDDTRTLDDLPTPERQARIPPDDLHVDGDNPNEMSDAQFGLLCERLAENGWLGGAIVTDTDGCIADGEHRWRAAQEIGLTEVPVKQYDIDDATRRLWRQELNKIHGEHDPKRDALEYDHLLSAGKTEEVEALTEAADEDLDDLLAELKTETATSPTYEYDPDHDVYFEDCVAGMADRLDDGAVDCVITDPPYGVDIDLTDSMGRVRETTHDGTVAADGDLEESLDLWDAVMAELTRVTTPEAHLYCFASWKTGHEFRRVIEAHDWTVRGVLVWVKNDANHLTQFGGAKARYGYRHEFCYFATKDDPRPIDGHPDDVYEVTEPRFEPQWMDRDVVHPTMKPVDLLAKLLANSTAEGDRVLDPFMGSGSTAVAAILNDRDYVGFELDAEQYQAVIEQRIGEAKRQREASVNQED